MEDFKFYFGDDTLFLEFNIPIKSDNVKNAISEIRNTFPNLSFSVVAYKNILGYWSAYHVKTGNTIYCGTMSIKTTKDNIKKYLENETKDNNGI